MGIDFSSSINGIRSSLAKNNVRSNNIANINSKGYKSRKAVQTDSSSGGPEIKSVSIDVNQGTLKSTNNPADLAIEGNGYFQVENSSGQKRYTRSLTLHTRPDGWITDQHGNKISGITESLQSHKNIHVEHDGTVIVQNEEGEETKIGRIMVMAFKDPQGLQSVGDGYYEAAAGAGTPSVNNSRVRVHQEMLEMSNVDLAEQVTGQISDEAAVKANIKAIKTQDDMLGDVIDLQG